MYDPTLGRFLSVDPLVSVTKDAFGYGNNNPITYTDPTGLCANSADEAAACFAGFTGEDGKRGVPIGGCSAQAVYCNITDHKDALKQFDDDHSASGRYDANVVKTWFNGVSNGNTWSPCRGREMGFGCKAALQLLGAIDWSQDLPWWVDPFSVGVSAYVESENLREAVAWAFSLDLALGAYAQYLMGGGRSLACSFSAPTRVRMADGTSKPISEVEPGDWVLAWDPDTGAYVERLVLEVIEHVDDDLLDLAVRSDDGTISVLETTEDHPFWSPEQGWVHAADLRPGAQLLDPFGSASVVSVGFRAGAQTMFNLSIDDVHTYVVDTGDSSAVVHNVGCDEYAKNRQRRAGGSIGSIHPPDGQVIPQGAYVNQPAGEVWAYHKVVVQNGRVWDQWVKGMPIADYKALWGVADDLIWSF